MAHAAAAAGFDAQRRLAASFVGVTEDVKWGADLVYSVGGKMFCIFLLRDKVAHTCSFKVDAERFLELTGVPGVIPAPYLARAHWVQVAMGNALSSADLNPLVQRSFDLVAAKLTNKLQREIGLAP